MQSIQKPLLFIGGGNMAHAIISGAIQAGVLDSKRVGVVDPNEDRRALYTNSFANSRDSVAWLKGKLAGTSSDTEDCGIVLAVKPQMLGAAAEGLSALIQEFGLNPTLISILAGTRAEQLGRAVEGCRVVRVMPNTPAAVGKGMSAVAGSETSNDADLELTEQLMGAVGEVVRIEESMMDAFTAVAGSGPAYVFYLVEAMTLAAESLGFDAVSARTIVEQTVIGSASLLESSDDPASELRARVTSKNGTTYAATTTLDEHGVMDGFVNALTAARDRGVELGREG